MRRRAALAAGRVGDPALVPALIDLMNDQEPLIRQMAAFALGLVGDASAVERLSASLADSDPVVRGRSAEALGRIGDTRAGPELARFVLATMPKGAPIVAVRGDDPGSVNDPWVELRLALVSLGRLKDVRSAELALLDQEKPRFDWWAATWVAMRLESPSLKPVLLAAAASNDPLSRSLAVRGLGALKDPAAVEVAAPLVRDKSEAVVVSALRALGAIGDARGVAAAAWALDSPSSAVQREALRALAVLPADRSLRPRIVPFVGSREPWIRAAATAALARSDRESFALVLSGLDPDPVWFVRSSLATTLGDVGDETSLSLLFGLLKDEDARVLPAVLEALRKARGPDSVDTLTRHLEHPDFAVRAAAAEGLVAQKATGVVPALAAAYRRGLSDVDLDARLAAVDALGVQADASAKETLREASRSDPSRVLRERASRALSTLGDTSPPRPGPDAERPPVDYRLTLLPYDPSPGCPCSARAPSSTRATGRSRSCSTWWRRRSPLPPSSTLRAAASTTGSPSTASSPTSWSRAAARGGTATADPATRCAPSSPAVPTAGGRWGWPFPARTPRGASSSSHSPPSRTSTATTRSSGRWSRAWSTWTRSVPGT